MSEPINKIIINVPKGYTGQIHSYLNASVTRMSLANASKAIHKNKEFKIKTDVIANSYIKFYLYLNLGNKRPNSYKLCLIQKNKELLAGGFVELGQRKVRKEV